MPGYSPGPQGRAGPGESPSSTSPSVEQEPKAEGMGRTSSGGMGHGDPRAKTAGSKGPIDEEWDGDTGQRVGEPSG